jgi:hypothetical protein
LEIDGFRGRGNNDGEIQGIILCLAKFKKKLYLQYHCSCIVKLREIPRNFRGFFEKRSIEAAIGVAQRQFLRVNEPKKTGTRIAQAQSKPLEGGNGICQRNCDFQHG